MTSIGLDYDFKDGNFIKDRLYYIMHKYNPSDLRLFISPTGRGYHIKFNTKIRFSVAELIKIRKKLGDDPNRISMVGRKYRDVLFDIKNVNGKIYRSKEIDVDSFILFGKEVAING